MAEIGLAPSGVKIARKAGPFLNGAGSPTLILCDPPLRMAGAHGSTGIEWIRGFR